MKIGIVGAGHAGIVAAQEAVKYNASVALFSEERFLPYYRPRIASVAFDQIGENDICVHPKEWYSDNKIELLLETRIIQINTRENILVSEKGELYRFDRVIIATGAKPIVPPFAKIIPGKVSPLWTLEDALTLRKKLPSIKNIVIIGGGAIGIESALKAADSKLNVCLVEKAKDLMTRTLSPGASATLKNILEGKNINLVMDSEIREIRTKGDVIEIETNFERICADFVLLSIGGIANSDISGLPGSNLGRGIEIDSNTRTSIPSLFAAGDATLFKGAQSPCSAIKANSQGKIAGLNATKDDNLAEYKPAASAIEIKFKDFELHSIGCNREGEGKREEVIESSSKIYRSIIKNNGSIAGIHMVGSGKDFISYKKLFKEEF